MKMKATQPINKRKITEGKFEIAKVLLVQPGITKTNIAHTLGVSVPTIMNIEKAQSYQHYREIVKEDMAHIKKKPAPQAEPEDAVVQVVEKLNSIDKKLDEVLAKLDLVAVPKSKLKLF